MAQWHNWKSAQVVNSHLMCNPAMRQPGFNLSRQQWSLLNHFRTEQGHCGACRRKWRLTDTDLCPCGKTQTMSHIVESCPVTKLNGGLSRLHSADEDAVSWLTSYGSWHAYEKKKKNGICFISGDTVWSTAYARLRLTDAFHLGLIVAHKSVPRRQWRAHTYFLPRSAHALITPAYSALAECRRVWPVQGIQPQNVVVDLMLLMTFKCH